MHDNGSLRSPPLEALASFAGGRPAHRLTGGMGTSWRAGDVVLKPSPGNAEARCLAEAHEELGETFGCRFQRPVPAPFGGWEIEGWTAWRWIDGKPAPERAREIVVAARNYHSALALLPCDRVLLSRADPWARADRVAWGEAQADYPTDYGAMLKPLLSEPSPNMPSQRVHGDLTGNVVFETGLSPGIIDPTHYWRPAAFAEAVVLVDQVWFAATLDLAPFADTPALGAMIRRAAARRIAEQPEQVAAGVKDADEALAISRRITAWVSAALDRLGFQ